MKNPLKQFYKDNYITLRETYGVKEAMNDVISKQKMQQ